MRQRISGMTIVSTAAALGVLSMLLMGCPLPEDPVSAPSRVTEGDGTCCSCSGCPQEAGAPSCPEKKTSPCRAEVPCSRCPGPSWTAFFLAPAPALIIVPDKGEVIGSVAHRPTELVFSPPKPPPRAAVLS